MVAGAGRGPPGGVLILPESDDLTGHGPDVAPHGLVGLWTPARRHPQLGGRHRDAPEVSHDDAGSLGLEAGAVAGRFDGVGTGSFELDRGGLQIQIQTGWLLDPLLDC